MSHLSSVWFLQSYTAPDHVHLKNLQEKRKVLVCLGFSVLAPVLISKIHKLVKRQKHLLFCIYRIWKPNRGSCTTGPVTIWTKRNCFSYKEIQHSRASPHFFSQSSCLNLSSFFLSLIRGAKYDRKSKQLSLELNNAFVQVPSSVNLITFKGHSSKKTQQQHYVWVWWKDLY